MAQFHRIDPAGVGLKERPAIAPRANRRRRLVAVPVLYGHSQLSGLLGVTPASLSLFRALKSLESAHGEDRVLYCRGLREGNQIVHTFHREVINALVHRWGRPETHVFSRR